MTTRFDGAVSAAARRLGSAVLVEATAAALQKEKDDDEDEQRRTCTTDYFCNDDDDNIEDAVSTLTEEFESLGIDLPPPGRCGPSDDAGSQRRFVNLTNASWSLVRKYRNLMKIHQDLEDSRRKLSNDNTRLTNRVERLKENVNKRDHALSEIEERERRLKVRSDQLSRQLKAEKEEATKLRKQLQSKDIQHAHEVRRIQQAGQKLCRQLEKSTVAAGTGKNIDKRSSQTDEMEKKVRIYEETIQRLRDKNGSMLEEIKELRRRRATTLVLHADGIELPVE